MQEDTTLPQPRPFAVPLSFVSGLLLGAAAGLIGVGGGEFRMPVLLYLLRRDVKTAAGINLVVGLITVALSLARRWGQTTWTEDALSMASVLATASVVGAVLGARLVHRFPSRRLIRAVVIYLFLVGVWMIVEAVTKTEFQILSPTGGLRIALATLVGFGVATFSTALGVAGGEMRIPALIYLFGYDVKIAGTLSLFASIPTVAGGAFTYRQSGYLPGWALGIAVVMGTGSLIGVMLGTTLLPYVDAHVLRGLLGAILLLATGALVLPAFGREPTPGGNVTALL